MTSPQLRSLCFLLLGFLLGIVSATAFLGRYTITTAATSSDSRMLIHCYRLNRWSGEIIGLNSAPYLGTADSLPGWSHARETAPEANPYLNAK